MKHRPLLWMIVLTMLLMVSFSVGATDQTTLTLLTALEQAFEHNAQYQLALWEHQLKLQEAEISQKTTPIINFTSTPIQVIQGELRPSTAQLNLDLPLDEYFNLTGVAILAMEDFEFDLESKLGLHFEYNFFTPSTPATHRESAADLLAINNNLIINVTGTMVELQKQLNLLDLEKERLSYRQAAYRSAEVTENTIQIQQLKQALTESETRIANYKLAITRLNQDLARLLNQTSTEQYQPSLQLNDFQIGLNQEELIFLALESNQERSQAIEAVARAENQLLATKQASGWKLGANANLIWDVDINQLPQWSVSVNANKTLYPKSLQAEKEELALAQAQLRLKETELNIRDQILQLIQKIESLTSHYQELTADLVNEEEELTKSKLHYEVGLVTELRLDEHQLELKRLKMELDHNRYDYLTSSLQLWHQTGYSLQTIIDLIVIGEV